MTVHCVITWEVGVIEQLYQRANSRNISKVEVDAKLNVVTLSGKFKADKGNGIITIAISGKKGRNKYKDSTNRFTSYGGGIRLMLYRENVDNVGIQHLRAVAVYDDTDGRDEEYNEHMEREKTGKDPVYGARGRPCNKDDDPDHSKYPIAYQIRQPQLI